MGIWGMVAKGALAIGKKIVGGIKKAKEKKVAKAAEKLIKRKEQLAAANALAEDSGAGAGVSQFGKALNFFKEATGGTPVKDDDTLKTPDEKPEPEHTPMWVWILVAVAALLLLPKLMGRR